MKGQKAASHPQCADTTQASKQALKARVLGDLPASLRVLDLLDIIDNSLTQRQASESKSA